MDKSEDRHAWPAKINAKLAELKRALFDSFVDLYNHFGEYRRLSINR